MKKQSDETMIELTPIGGEQGKDELSEQVLDLVSGAGKTVVSMSYSEIRWEYTQQKT